MELTYLYYHSGAKQPFHRLSNFYEAKFHFGREHVVPEMRLVQPNIDAWLGAKGKSFASSEHLWQALKAKGEYTFSAFTLNGKFSTYFPELFELTMPRSAKDTLGSKKYHAKIANKMTYWGKRECIGIVAKMAANRKHGKALGIATVMNYDCERLESQVERAIWLAILEQKFRQCHLARAIMLGSGTLELIEFDRAASRSKGDVVHWGGYMTPDGVLKGENVMGRYLMEIRAKLLAEKMDA